VPRNSAPLLPVLPVPEDMTRKPEAPAEPALAVCRRRVPVGGWCGAVG
jgi:hypothetical protein